MDRSRQGAHYTPGPFRRQSSLVSILWIGHCARLLQPGRLERKKKRKHQQDHGRNVRTYIEHFEKVSHHIWNGFRLVYLRTHSPSNENVAVRFQLKQKYRHVRRKKKQRNTHSLRRKLKWKKNIIKEIPRVIIVRCM